MTIRDGCGIWKTIFGSIKTGIQFVELNTAPIAAEVSKEVRRLFLAEYIDNYLCICCTIRIDDYQCEVFL